MSAIDSAAEITQPSEDNTAIVPSESRRAIVFFANHRPLTPEEMDRCREYCQDRGYELLPSLPARVDVTDLSDDHPADVMREENLANVADVFVGYSATRLFDSLDQLDHFMQAAQNNGVQLDTVREGAMIPGSDALELAVARIDFRRAKRYLLKVTAKVRTANMKARGMCLGRAPQGYVINRDEKGVITLVQDEKIAPKIQKIFMLASDGLTTNDLVLKAEEMGLRTAGGLPPSPAFINRILRNTAYAGFPPGSTEPGDYPPIVSLEVFEKVKGLLDNRRRNKPRI